jgi:hypothetical protein
MLYKGTKYNKQLNRDVLLKTLFLHDDIKFLVRQGWSKTDLLGCQEDVDQVILEARARSSFSLDFMKQYHYIVFYFDRIISVVEGFLCQPDWSLDQLIKQYETHFTSFSTSRDDFLNVILGGKSRREEVENILKTCLECYQYHGTETVLTNNTSVKLIKDIMKHLTKQEIRVLRNPAEKGSEKCTIVDGLRSNSGSKYLFLDNDPYNFGACKENVTRVCITEKYPRDAPMPTNAEREANVRTLFENDNDLLPLARALEFYPTERRKKPKIYFDPGSGIRENMLSRTFFEKSSKEWNAHILQRKPTV